MVDFRYHVVSIVAVFLALGIGIVFGTTAINRTILNDLDHNVTRLTNEKRGLESQRKQLATQVGAADAWGKALFPGLVAGVLTGERVVVVTAPDASKSVRDDLVKQLGTAGATVTGRIRLNDALLDPARAAELDDLVLRELPTGFTVPGGGATAAQRAMAELAYVISLGAGDTTALGTAPPAATTRVLAALRERGFIGVDGGTVSPARNVVVLLPGAPPSPTPTPTASGPDARPVGVDLVAALAALRARPVVVAAAPNGGSGAGTELDLVRADPLLKETVSSVDDVDSVYGQTALVLAVEEAHRGRVGHYGNGVGADAPVPTPAPSP
ncbi:MAG: hypothetical protein QOE45_1659 [Frankiaceae bacterium]|nr:hypothetical protein [Frankiaceae bacterium]